MKKKILALLAPFASFAAFAQEGSGMSVDTTVADGVITAGKDAITSFISTNGPVIGMIVAAILAIPLIMVGFKLVKRVISKA